MSKYSDAQVELLSRIFGALSNPTRLRIVMRLASCCAPGTVCDAEEGAACCVGDLGEDLGVCASTVSHHLKELRAAGLMRSRRRGRRIECWIDPEVLRALARFFSAPLGGAGDAAEAVTARSADEGETP
ncbi:MAG: ArsR/SmtB family transcription factor [Armatimonadota bacterium]